jgi:uncharacterized linocin/CFP29 family protein
MDQYAVWILLTRSRVMHYADQQALHVLIQLEGSSLRGGWAVGQVPEIPTVDAAFVLMDATGSSFATRIVTTTQVKYIDHVQDSVPAVVFETASGSVYSLVALTDLVAAYRADDLTYSEA